LGKDLEKDKQKTSCWK